MYYLPECLFVLSSLQVTVWGVASGEERAAFLSPDKNARAGETAPKWRYQPTLATPFVTSSFLFYYLDNQIKNGFGTENNLNDFLIFIFKQRPFNFQ